MPEGPEVKIASDYFNKRINVRKKIIFKVISEYYNKKYKAIFEALGRINIINKKSYTIGKNIFLKVNKNQVLNLHPELTKFLVNKYLSEFEIKKACQIFSKNPPIFTRSKIAVPRGHRRRQPHTGSARMLGRNRAGVAAF